MVAGETHQADIGSNAHNFPFKPATRVLFAQADNVPLVYFDKHRREL